MFEARYLEKAIESNCFQADKMAFVAGPRQAGKTTMAKRMLSRRKYGYYYNWDEITFRRQWTKDPSKLFIQQHYKIKPLLVLDEIHKAKLWKRQLKGIYDTLVYPCDILVTGSARLNVYRKGSDSLMGRYYYFRLHPFSVGELLRNKFTQMPDKLFFALLNDKPYKQKKLVDSFNALFKFGPFPEPLFAASTRRLNLWRRGRVEKIIREDLRDISRLPELSQVEMLVSLLPEKVANPLSIRSLSEDLEVAYTTVKRWLTYLRELYYYFELKPYAKSLKRGIKKEGKCFLWDWSEVEDESARFENMMACHLLKYCHYLTDIGEGVFDLRYIRNKQKKEIDFLITKAGKPWLPIEAKLNNLKPSENWRVFMPDLRCPLAIQVTYKSNVYDRIEMKDYTLLLISADRFLKFLC